MLNREIMKKTITDLKNNKEFLKKERKIEKYEKWIKIGREEVFGLSAIPAALTVACGIPGSIAYGACNPENETLAAIGLVGSFVVAGAMAVGSALAETYCVSDLPEKQGKLINEIDDTIKHNYVKNGVIEYYQSQGLTEKEAQDKVSEFCKNDLVKGPSDDCEYSYDQFDEDMAKYIEENDGFNYNDFAVLDDTSEMVE